MAELYALRFPNGKAYVGVTEDLDRRVSRHAYSARRGSLFPVHCAMRKHLTFEVIRIFCGTMEQMLELETAAIEALGTLAPAGYNVAKGGESPMTGRKHSDDWKRAKSEQTKEFWKRDRAKMLAAQTGGWTPERRLAMSNRMRGNTFAKRGS